MWEDNSLVKIFGCALASDQNPMALIMEFFPLGPLNLYLQWVKHLLFLWVMSTPRRTCVPPNLILVKTFTYYKLCLSRNNKDKINHVNLVETSVTLARALWYLEENSLVHSNIRCRLESLFPVKSHTFEKHQTKARYTLDIFAHNIAIKRHFSSNIFFPVCIKNIFGWSFF